MRIILDNDGTVTEFNTFIEEYALPYFKEKYDLDVKYPATLEIEDKLDLTNYLIETYGYNLEEAKKIQRKMLNDFWFNPFIAVRFALFTKMKKGVKEYLNEQITKGAQIEIHTSRKEATNKGFIGYLVREATILYYKINGIKIKQQDFYFYQNDDEKIEGIKSRNPDIVFDDKTYVIETLSKSNIKCICLDGIHNKNIMEDGKVKKSSDFTKENLDNKIASLIGVKNLEIYERAQASDILFRKLHIFKSTICAYFKPIILNPENIKYKCNQGILYAPNHRSTLDPLAILGVVGENIHWAALKRFFDAEDSLFNNSKNPFLCKLTKYLFENLDYFPIERKTDNENSNNMQSILDMTSYLNNHQIVGIFPEGTTRREAGKDFGNFDRAFIILAKKTKSIVQPITTLWISDLNLGPKLIMNFGTAIDLQNLNTKDAMNIYLEEQKKNLAENMIVKEQIENNEEELKKLLKMSKKYYN